MASHQRSTKIQSVQTHRGLPRLLSFLLDQIHGLLKKQDLPDEMYMLQFTPTPHPPLLHSKNQDAPYTAATWVNYSDFNSSIFKTDVKKQIKTISGLLSRYKHFDVIVKRTLSFKNTLKNGLLSRVVHQK